MEYGDRYLRAPLFAFYDSFPLIWGRKRNFDESLLNRDFCSFVVSSSGGDPIRHKFFTELSKYKKVASGGRYLNNIGGPVDDKLAFIRKFKFNIAFENSSSPGYVTEKIMEAFSAQTVPIYYGDPLVNHDFNPDSFIHLRDESDIERVVDEIIHLDRDDDAYMKVAVAQCMANDDKGAYEREIEAFLVKIFEQPFQSAKRRPRYGWQADQCRRKKPFIRMFHRVRQCAWFGMGIINGRLDFHVFKG